MNCLRDGEYLKESQKHCDGIGEDLIFVVSKIFEVGNMKSFVLTDLKGDGKVNKCINFRTVFQKMLQHQVGYNILN